MRFRGRLKVGFGLAKRSVRVLRSHPELLAFQLIGGAAGLAFVLTPFDGLFVTGAYEHPGPVLYGALFVACVVETFVAAFFAAGLVAATRTVFEDRSVTENLRWTGTSTS